MKKMLVFTMVFLGFLIQQASAKDFPWNIFMPAINAAAQRNVVEPKNVEIVQVVETWSGISVPAIRLSFDTDTTEVDLEGLFGYLEIRSPSTGSGVAPYILEGEEVRVWMPPGLHKSLRMPRFFLFKGRWTTFVPLSYVCEEFSRIWIAAKDYTGEENEWYPDLTKLSIGNDGIELVCHAAGGCHLDITACTQN